MARKQQAEQWAEHRRQREEEERRQRVMVETRTTAQLDHIAASPAQSVS